VRRPKKLRSSRDARAIKQIAAEQARVAATITTKKGSSPAVNADAA
jgi:hypothetical protein